MAKVKKCDLCKTRFYNNLDYVNHLDACMTKADNETAKKAQKEAEELHMLTQPFLDAGFTQRQSECLADMFMRNLG